MTRVYLALGGNLGPVEQSFQRALDLLNALPTTRVVVFSSVHRFAAVGVNAGGEFRNAAAAIETSLEPLVLLDCLQQMEDVFGRERQTRWSPRPIDLDVILFGDRVIDHPRLRIPHPACWYRRFVLDPMSEIAESAIHPEKRLSFGELRRRLLVRPLPVAVAGGNAFERTRLIERLSAEFPAAAVSDAGAPGVWEDPPGYEPALLAWLGSGDDTRHREFETLPVAPRLDVSTAIDQVEFLRDVLHSALGQ